MQAATKTQDIDWPLIQTYYTSGLTPKAISEQTGVKADTISARASRYNWRELTNKAKSVVQVTVNQPNEETALSKQSERARSGLAATLERFVAKIETLDPKTAKAALKASGELESVVRNCKTVFGWSESSQQPSVRINILGSATIATDTPKEGLNPSSTQGQIQDSKP